MDGFIDRNMIINYLDIVLNLGFLKNVYFLAAVFVIIGALYCFLGYKIFKFQMAIAAFIAGVVFGYLVFVDAVDTLLIAILIGVVIGVACAIVAVQFYRVGLFICVGFLGFLAGYLAVGYLIAGVILGIVFGVAGFFFDYHVIIIATSVFGGMVLCLGLNYLIDMNKIIFLSVTAIFSAGGLLVQYKINRAARLKEKTTRYHAAKDGSITQKADDM